MDINRDATSIVYNGAGTIPVNTDMNFDGIDEVITTTEDGKIVVYSVESNFN